MSYPIIHVRNFARIKKADIELAPLTLFVGDNNSGKSYLSSLIWGFSQQNLPSRLFQEYPDKDENDFQPDNALRQWMEKGLREELYDDVMAVSEETQRFLVSKINVLLNREKKKFLRTLFRRSIDIDGLSLGIPYDAKLNFRMVVSPYPQLFYDHLEDRRQVQFTIGKAKWGMPIRNIKDQNLFQKLFRTLLRAYFLSYFYGTCSFFPASRTGFLLTYKSLISESLERNFGARLKFKKHDASSLTKPQRAFLRSLVRSHEALRGARSDEIQRLIGFVEKNMIGGTLSLNNQPVSDLLYRPDGLEDNLPMFLASGVVTEIAPLLAHLKYDNMASRWVIEEPEMALHPELQRRMAQVLIRLSNLFDSVLVTTHSDLIVQHVNNMIKLTHREDGQELAREHGYTDEDIISADRVRMYQFKAEANHQTAVERLDSDHNGFPVPTFGDALRSIRKDVIAFYNDDEEPSERRERK